jgi:tryptophanyl-tRNA synthetase
MSIYSCFTGKTYEEIEKEFEGRGYGDFKLAVGEACAEGLAPIQAEYKRLMADKGYLEGLLRENADKASYIAGRTLSKVYRKIGFLAK